MIKHPQIFGILNITPDSFSDGGMFFSKEKAIEQANKLIADGANFIDIGGESTKPNAVEISADQEWERLENVLENLFQAGFSPIISLDTKNHLTAKKFLKLGGKILNDVSGFNDPQMRDLAPNFKKIIVNHFPGKTLREVHEQKINSINQVIDDLANRKEELIKAGVDWKKIILDPGIGFGKTTELNWQLLEIAKLLPNEQILIGHSKKRFLGENRFEPEPNIEAAKIAIQSGCKFLRVHDPAIYKSLILSD